ncbi:MAG: FxsA family protein [Akkermansiaceae bacterium]
MFGKLLTLFILIPLAELFLFATLGKQLGWDKTVAIVILTAILGAALTKSQGRAALEKLHKAIAEGRMPHNEATDGILILIAGAVLLTPGFLTDLFGFLLLLPPVRALLRGRLASKLKEQIKGVTPDMEPTPRKSSHDNGNVIDV